MTPDEQKEFDELEAAEKAEFKSQDEVNQEAADADLKEHLEEKAEVVNVEAEIPEEEEELEDDDYKCKVLKSFYVRDPEKRMTVVGEMISTSLITQEHIDLDLVFIESEEIK